MAKWVIFYAANETTQKTCSDGSNCLLPEPSGLHPHTLLNTWLLVSCIIYQHLQFRGYILPCSVLAQPWGKSCLPVGTLYYFWGASISGQGVVYTKSHMLHYFHQNNIWRYFSNTIHQHSMSNNPGKIWQTWYIVINIGCTFWPILHWLQSRTADHIKSSWSDIKTLEPDIWSLSPACMFLYQPGRHSGHSLIYPFSLSLKCICETESTAHVMRLI